MDNITINSNKNIISEQEKLLYIEELSQSYQAQVSSMIDLLLNIKEWQ